MIVFVDYPDGAGGEFLSEAIGMHTGWYRPEVVEESTLRVNHCDVITSFLMQKRFENYNHWDSTAESCLQELKAKIGDINICIPYHSCLHNHNRLLKSVFPDCKIITVKPVDDREWQLVNTDIIRKLYLIPLDFRGVQYFFKKFGFNQRVDIRNFLRLDGFLLRQGSEINNQTRLEYLNKVKDFRIDDWQPSDYTVSWRNLFLDISAVRAEYTSLCTFLNIEPEENILNHIMARNQRNLDQLMDYDLNGEIIKHLHITEQA